MKINRPAALCLSAALLLGLCSCVSPDPPLSATPAPSAAPSPSAGANVVTALDNQNCLIRVLGVDPEAEAGYTVNAELTNRTKKVVRFGLRHAAVNGVQTDPPFSVEIPAGETAEAAIVLKDDVLEYYGVTEFTDIELNFLASDAEDLTAELDNDIPIHIYPAGKVEPYVRDEKSDRLIFENSSVKAVLISYYQDRKTGFAANVHLTNKTDLPLNFTLDDATLNSLPCDPNFFVTVAPGKQLFTTFYWSPACMIESGVDDWFLAKGDTDEPEEEIEEMSFRLRVYDSLGRVPQDLVDEEIVFALEKEEEAEPSPSPAPTASP